MSGVLFYVLLAACAHDGEQCFDVRMITVQAVSRHACLAILQREMQNWGPDAPVIVGDCVTSLAAAPVWWRNAEVASY